MLFWNQKEKLEMAFLIFIPIAILIAFIRQFFSTIENNCLFDELKKAHNNLEEKVELAQSYEEPYIFYQKHWN